MAKLLELQLQHQSFQCVFRVDLLKIDWLHLLAGQGTLKSLLQHQIWRASILYGPTLTSLHDYWKNHSFDYMDPGFLSESPSAGQNVRGAEPVLYLDCGALGGGGGFYS